MTKSLITTHVLDTAKGIPASGIAVKLFRLEDGDWVLVDSGTTDVDGRIMQWSVADDELRYGDYKLTFNLNVYLGEKRFTLTLILSSAAKMIAIITYRYY